MFVKKEVKAIKHVIKMCKLWDKSLVIPGKKNELSWDWLKVTVSHLVRLHVTSFLEQTTC